MEGETEATWAHKKEQMEKPPEKARDFHMGEVVDPVEALIEQVGWEDALEQINTNMEQHPDDAEARRQATLIVRLYDEKVKPLRDKLQH